MSTFRPVDIARAGTLGEIAGSVSEPTGDRWEVRATNGSHHPTIDVIAYDTRIAEKLSPEPTMMTRSTEGINSATRMPKNEGRLDATEILTLASTRVRWADAARSAVVRMRAQRDSF